MNRFFKCRLASSHLILERIKEQLQVISLLVFVLTLVVSFVVLGVGTLVSLDIYIRDRADTIYGSELFLYQTTPWVWAVIGAGLFVLWLKSTFCR